MASKKTQPDQVELSYAVSQQHLLLMLERCSVASESADGKILMRVKGNDDGVTGELSITAVGMPLSVISRVETGPQPGGSITVAVSGACVVLLKDFRSLVSAMPVDLLDIKCTKEGKLTIQAAGHADKPKRRTFTVYALTAEEYPPVPPFPVERPTRSIKGAVLNAAIDRVRYASDQVKEVDVHSGVLLVLSAGVIESVATNRNAMAINRIDAEVQDPPEEFLLPKAMIGLTMALGAAGDNLNLAQDESRIYVEDEGTLLSCLKSVGQFPPWRVVRDALKDLPIICTLDSLQLAEAVRAVSTLFRLSYVGKKLGEPIVLKVEGNKLTVEAGFTPTGAELAGSTEEIDVSEAAHAITRYLEAGMFTPSAAAARGLARLRTDPKDDIGMVAIESGDGKFLGLTSPKRPS